MNYSTESRTIFLAGIDANKNIPAESKHDIKEIIRKQFEIMLQTVGTFELMYLRERQDYSKLIP